MQAAPKRLSAAERRSMILAAAVAEFAEHGLDGTSVDAIATAVGVTQPYVFRLFGSKQELFLATIEHAFGLTEGFFRAEVAQCADGRASAEMLDALGVAYRGWATTALLRFQLQAYAACAHPEVRRAVTARMRTAYGIVRDSTGADPQDLSTFFARGMVLNILAVISPGAADLVGWLTDG